MASTKKENQLGVAAVAYQVGQSRGLRSHTHTTAWQTRITQTLGTPWRSRYRTRLGLGPRGHEYSTHQTADCSTGPWLPDAFALSSIDGDTRTLGNCMDKRVEIVLGVECVSRNHKRLDSGRVHKEVSCRRNDSFDRRPLAHCRSSRS